MIDKRTLVTALRPSAGAEFITRAELTVKLGYKCPKSVDKLIAGLERVNGSRYLISDVADRILAEGVK